MQIKWFGQACFQITDNNGFTIITDPFDDTLGYPRPPISAQLVTISHGHFDHNDRTWIRGNPVYLDKATHREMQDTRIDSFPSYHDGQKGAMRGSNLIFSFQMEGLRVCHLGDLGHQPDDLLLNQLGKVDVLLIPVGDTYTLNGEQAWTLVQRMKPRVTIPMHYQTEALTLKLDGADTFLRAAGVESKPIPAFVTDLVAIQQAPAIVVLDWKQKA